MTPEQFKASRERLGYTQRELANLWHMADEARPIQRWETGRAKLPGTAIYAMQMMIKHGERKQ